MRRRLLILLCLTAMICPAAAETVPRALFVPLDDRPSTLLFVRQIARIGGAWLTVPARAWLGRALTPGRPERITQWLESPDTAKGCEVAIVSADMLAYGGLVASRNAATSLETALHRLDALDTLRKHGLRTEVFTVIPRLSLRTSDLQAPYERRLAQWATVPGAPPPDGVPASVVEEYLQVRQRNLALNLELISRVASGRIDRLIIGQDDSAGTGLHADDQHRIREAVSAQGLDDRVMVLSGADEIAMDMVAGWLARRYGHAPTVRVHYSDPAAAHRIPPLESLPLEHAVQAHVALAGGRMASPSAAADVTLYLQTPLEKPYALPPPETQAPSAALAEEIRAAVLTGHPTALGDVALINMADPYLARAVIKRVPLHRLQGYAAWNTPSNKIGTVLAQSLTHRLAARFGHTWSTARVIDSERTHQAFLLARLVDDYRYQAILRAAVRPRVAGLDPDADPLLNLYGPVGLEIRLALIRYAQRLFDRRFRGHRVYLPGLRQWAVLDRVASTCTLPWLRLFEVELCVDLRLCPQRSRPPAPRLRNLGPEPTPTEGPSQEQR